MPSWTGRVHERRRAHCLLALRADGAVVVRHEHDGLEVLGAARRDDQRHVVQRPAQRETHRRRARAWKVSGGTRGCAASWSAPPEAKAWVGFHTAPSTVTGRAQPARREIAVSGGARPSLPQPRLPAFPFFLSFTALSQVLALCTCNRCRGGGAAAPVGARHAPVGVGEVDAREAHGDGARHCRLDHLRQRSSRAHTPCPRTVAPATLLSSRRLCSRQGAPQRARLPCHSLLAHEDNGPTLGGCLICPAADPWYPATAEAACFPGVAARSTMTCRCRDRRCGCRCRRRYR